MVLGRYFMPDMRCNMIIVIVLSYMGKCVVYTSDRNVAVKTHCLITVVITMMCSQLHQSERVGSVKQIIIDD